MAENEDKGLIGFDPLAWMENESEDDQKAEKVNATNRVEHNADDEKEPFEDIKIVLDSKLTIQNVSVLYEQLKKLLDKQNKIEIDASAVEQIDTANLQLLGVLKQTAVNLHKEVIFDFPSESFIEAAELLGISEILEVDQAAAGFF